MGSGRVLAGYRYSPPSHPPSSHPTPGTPLPRQSALWVLTAVSGQPNSAVGLISVQQLTLDVHFSGSRGITEVYNLALAGIPNDQNLIPGFE